MTRKKNRRKFKDRKPKIRSEQRVTDHALVRWLERVHGINTSKLKREILNEVGQYLEMEPISVHKNGYDYKIKEGRVITVIRE